MVDKPETNEEIIAGAKRTAADSKQSSEWYKISRQANETGTCELCGWQDGDGIKTCFYSSTLGAVTHQNSIEGATRTMTPEQASLVGLRSKLLYISAEAREKFLSLQWLRTVEREKEHRLKSPQPFIMRDGQEIPIEQAHEEYCAKQRQGPTAEDYPYRAWVQNEWWIIGTGTGYDNTPPDLVARSMTDKYGTWYAWMVHCKEPHPNCGGIQVDVAPYHLRCSKCGVEVRLWEHGIDYDIG